MTTYDELLGTGAAARGRARHPAPFATMVVRGPDAIDFLQRLCAQDVVETAVGESRPAAFLNPKGKLIATCTAGKTDDGVWLETEASQMSALAETIDRYHFTERLEIVPRPDLVCGEVMGSDALATLDLSPGTCREIPGGVLLTGARNGLAWARYHAPESFFDPPPWGDLDDLDETTAEALRICARIPRVGVDTDEGTLGLEAALDDHVSTTKGCYTGQEIVARIHTYGHVNRKLCLLEIASTEAPAIGTALLEPEEGDPVGRVMSSAPTPDGKRYVALGYLPADFWSAGTELRLGSADGPMVRVHEPGPGPA